jgi:O-antigen/teichoic acid export membrane protein
MNDGKKNIISLRSVLDIVHASWGQIVVAAIAVAGIRIYTELLDRTNFGYAMLAMGGIAFLDGLVIMAFSQTLLSLCAQTADRDRQRQITAGLAFRMLRLVGAVSAIVLAIAIPIAGFWGDVEFILAVPILSFLYLASEIFKASMLSPLVVNREYLKYSTWCAGEAVIGLVITVIVLMLFTASAEGYVIGFLISRILSTVFFCGVYFRGSYFFNVDRMVAGSVVTTALSQGWPVSVLAPLNWIGNYIDRYIVTAIVGAANTGSYTAIMGLVGRPYGLTSSILTSYFRPQLYRHNIPDEDVSRWNIQWRWVIVAFVIGSAGTVAFVLLGSFISSIVLAPEYRSGARQIMIFLGIAQTFTIMTHGLENAILSKGRSAALLKTQCGLVIITLSLIPISILWLGVVGAAVGRSFAELIKFFITMLLSYRILK